MSRQRPPGRVPLQTHAYARDHLCHPLVLQTSTASPALAEALAFFQSAQDNLAGTASPPLGLHIALGLAAVHLARGEPGSAVEALTPLLDDALARAQRVVGLRRLGAAKRDLGELDAALKYYTDALELASEQEQPDVLLGLAQTHFDRNELEAAQSHAQRALQEHSDGSRAEALGLLGGIAYRQDNLQSAAELVAQSLEQHRGRGNRSGAAAAYANLGVLAAVRDNAVAARDSFMFSLELRTALGDAQGVAVVCKMERNSGRLEAAAQHLERAVRTARHAELARVLVQSLSNLGAVQTEAEQFEAAKASLDEAEARGRRYGFDDLRCGVLCKRAKWAVEMGDYSVAEREAREALGQAQALKAADLVEEAQRVLARALQETTPVTDAPTTQHDTNFES